MLNHFRIYQKTISRAVILLFMLTGSLGVWATSAVAIQPDNAKPHCTEHLMTADTGHSQHEKAPDPLQHDCCKTQQTCNKHCCKFCPIGSMSNMVLLASFTLPVIFQSAQYDPANSILPLGEKPATLDHPPQALLI